MWIAVRTNGIQVNFLWKRTEENRYQQKDISKIISIYIWCQAEMAHTKYKRFWVNIKSPETHIGMSPDSGKTSLWSLPTQLPQEMVQLPRARRRFFNYKIVAFPLHKRQKNRRVPFMLLWDYSRALSIMNTVCGFVCCPWSALLV